MSEPIDSIDDLLNEPIDFYHSSGPTKRLEQVTDEINIGINYTQDIVIPKEESKSFPTAIPLLRVADIQSNKLQEPEFFVIPEKIQITSPDPLRTGDLLFSIKGKLGKVALWDERLAGSLFSSGLARIRCSDSLKPEFLFYFFQSPYYSVRLNFLIKYLKHLEKGLDTEFELKMADLCELIVPVPPLEIQEEALAYCSENHADIAIVLEHLYLKQLPQFISQRVLENASLNWLASLEFDSIRISDVKQWLYEENTSLNNLREYLIDVFGDEDADIDEWTERNLEGINSFVDFITNLYKFITDILYESNNLLSQAYQNPLPGESLVLLERAKNYLLAADEVIYSTDDRIINLFESSVIGLNLLIETEMKNILSQLRLKIGLINESIPVGESADLILRVENPNSTTVYDIHIIILTIPEALQGENFYSSVDIRGLSSGEEVLIRFPVFSDTAGNYLAEVFYCFNDLYGKFHFGFIALDILFEEETEHAYEDILRIPYITGTAVDTPEMFFGREDILEFLRKNLIGKYQNNVILLQGNRRTGKSSLLKHVVNISLLGNAAVPVYIDCQKFGNLDEHKLFYKIAREIAKELKSAGVDVSIPKRVDIASDDAFWDFSILLESYQERLRERQLVLLLDEFEYIDAEIEKGNLDPRVTENFRHLFQHRKNLAIVLTGSYRLTKLREEYWSALFGIALEKDISVLDEADARALITKPLEQYVQYTPNAVSRIIELTACHPYFVQMFCHTLIGKLNESKDTSLITLQRVENAIPLCIDKASGHIKYMYSCAETIQQQFILRLVAEKGSLSMQEINTEFQKRGILTNAKRIRKTIDHLREYELLMMKKSASETFYCLKFALFQNWVKKNVDWDEVANRALEDI